ncbi:MAG TPA: hypothetical protein VFK19_12880 [Sphingomicrobium sp.]|nr:hypothetical protein [Sphingomicrobium sp.]
MDDWPFNDPPDFATITTRAIMHDDDWIALVSHDAEDGAWQFLGPDGAPAIDDGMVVCLHHLLEKDRLVAELADLPLGWRAWRETASNPWQRAPHDV